MLDLIKAIKENKFDPTSKLFQEKLFEYYKVTGYSAYCLNSLSQEVGIKPGVLKTYIYSYMKSELGIDKEEFDKYIETKNNDKNENVSEEAKLSEYMKSVINLINEELKLNYEEDLNKFIKESNLTLKKGVNIEDMSFDEKLYRYFKSFNYSKLSLSNISKRLNIKSAILREYIYSYVKRELGMGKNEFDTFIKEEKEKNKTLYIARINIVLKEMGINVNYLWTDEEEKEKFLRTIYEYSSKHEFTLESTRMLALKLNISNSRYLELIKLYMVEYLKKPIDEVNNEVNLNLNRGDQRRVNNEVLKKLFNDIVNSKTPEEIGDILSKTGYNLANLSESVGLSKNIFDEKKLEIYKQKISEYRAYKNKRSRDAIAQRAKEQAQEKLEKNRNYIYVYMQEKDKTHEEILSMLELTEEEFRKKLLFIKRNDRELHDKFMEYRKEKEMSNIIDKGNGLDGILSQFINGIDENGVNRPFDILDYLSFTDMPTLKFFRSISGALDKNVYFKLKDFADKNKRSGEDYPREYKGIMEERLVIGVKRDDDGNIIPGSGREILVEEKEKIINYLKENNYPLNRHTYKAALNRYLNNFLTFDSSGKVLGVKLTKNDKS